MPAVAADSPEVASVAAAVGTAAAEVARSLQTAAVDQRTAVAAIVEEILPFVAAWAAAAGASEVRIAADFATPVEVADPYLGH